MPTVSERYRYCRLDNRKHDNGPPMHLEKFMLRFENGEELVSCKNMEPEGDFAPPRVGMAVCAKVKGSKWPAWIIEVS